MEALSDENPGGYIVIALGTEEAMILLQPGALLRTVVGREPALRSGVRFLTFRTGAGGLLAALPAATVAALLSSPAGHPVERELQEILFGRLDPAPAAAFFVGAPPPPGHTFPTPQPLVLAAPDDENQT